jgi:membrane protein involved in colicin uptake
VTKSSSNNSIFFELAKLVAALVAMLAFGCFVYYMLGQTKTAETEWTRAVYLFQGVEAVAFAAAGFIFGKEVHRERAEKAEKRAAEGEKEAAKGKALADLVKSKAHTHPAKAASIKAMSPSVDQVFETTRGDLDDLANTARDLFP